MKTKKPLSKKQIIKKWIEALRSGKYKQTRSELSNSKGQCCLGVLCIVAGEQFNLKPLFDDNEKYIYGFRNSSRTYESTPPIKMQQFLGLRLNLKNECGETLIERLIAMNDTEGKSFKRIATYLEKQLL